MLMSGIQPFMTDAERESARHGARGRSTERKDNTKDRSDEDCVFWLQGDCKKGLECKFKHDPKKQGTEPDAVS